MRSEELKKSENYFDIDNREFVVTSADNTAYSTIGGLKFGENFKHSLYFSTGAGFCWDDEDARECRLTRFCHGGSEEGKHGKFFYLRDINSGKFWSVGSQPVTTTIFQSYRCRIGFGYTEIESIYNDIKTTLRTFIPLDRAAPEVSTLFIENLSQQIQHIEVFSFVEFPSGTPQQEATNPQNFTYVNVTDTDDIDPRIVVCSTFWRRNDPDEPNKNRKLISFGTSKKPFDIETSLTRFEGVRGSCANPVRVGLSRKGINFSRGNTGIASHKIILEIKPQKSERIDFALSSAHTHNKIRESTTSWVDNTERIEKSFIKLQDYTRNILANFHCSIPDPDTEVMANTWGQFQVYANWLFSRSVGSRASGQSRGLGTRDSWQDILGYTSIIPNQARKRIINMLQATHLKSGAAYHSYNPRTGKSVEGENFSDDHLWSIPAIDAYLKETGDMNLLNEEIPYVDASSLTEPVYDHLKRILTYTFNKVGPNGIPLILRADWNDALQRLYKGFYCHGYSKQNLEQKLKNSNAESVMVAGLFVRAARDLRNITVVRSGESDPYISVLDQMIATVTHNVNKSFWNDSEGYYAAGTNDEGKLFGTPAELESNIFLIPQVWAVLSGIATPMRKQKCMDATMGSLYYEGGLLLNYPAFDKSQSPLGSLHFYPPFFKENGACFCHAAAMGVTALLLANMPDSAYDAFKANLPPLVSKKDPILYSAAPYTWCQVINGQHGEFGAGGDWLTGAAAWNLRAVQQFMLGVQPEFNGLRIDPCIPSGWKSYEVMRTYRGGKYKLFFDNPEGVNYGIKKVQINGFQVDSQQLPILSTGAECSVEVLMGTSEKCNYSNDPSQNEITQWIANQPLYAQEVIYDGMFTALSESSLADDDRRLAMNIITELYGLSIPYCTECGLNNIYSHGPIVLDSALKIALDEKLNFSQIKVLIAASLLHDLGFAQSDIKRVSIQEIEELVLSNAQKSQIQSMVQEAIKYRREHMKHGALLAKKLIQQANQHINGAFSPQEADDVVRLISIHDKPKIAKYITKYGIYITESTIHLSNSLFDDSDKLALIFREADMLFQLTYTGIIVDLYRQWSSSFTEQFKYNLSQFKEERNIYDSASLQCNFVDTETVFRTKKGYELYSWYCNKLLKGN